ncbi:MAG: flagellar basal-body rod protein FlgF [Pseudomonadota bacterium]
MENISYILLSRQKTLRNAVDVVANNIANIDTSGFKRESLNFREYVETPRARFKYSFVEDIGHFRDHSSGPIRVTGNSLDVAINGDGWFQIQSPQGIRYTRHGSFQTDLDNRLVTHQGDPVLDEDGLQITIPLDEGPIQISSDGVISTEFDTVAKLAVVRFDSNQALNRGPNNLYSTDQATIPLAKPQVTQGALEGSNVQAISELTKMIGIHRQHDRLTRSIETDYQRQLSAIDRILRVQ